MSEQRETMICRREFLASSLTAVTGMICVDSWSKTIGAFTPSQFHLGQSKPAVHNMLILGTQTLFFYHLPMFNFKGFESPHRYQVILEARGGDLQFAIAEDRKKHPKTKFYTFSPQPFVLEDFAKRPLGLLGGSLFRGHLEKGGTQILKFVLVDARLVYFKEFIPNARRPRSLEYILFGAESELFLAHLITAPPDFDQILSVSILGRTPSPTSVPTREQLKNGVKVAFPRNSNLLTRRLRAKRRLIGEMQATPGVFEGRVLTERQQTVELVSQEEVYFEEGELRAPPEFAATPAEKAAEKAAGFP